MLSAICSNLDQSKILLSGNELKHQKMPKVNNTGVNMYLNSDQHGKT